MKKQASASSKKTSSKSASTQKNRKKLIIQFAEYMISGGAYFWVGYLIFFVADKGLGWNLFWAKLASNIAGWTVNYILQRYWVFRNPNLKGQMAQTSGRYIFITLVNFGLDYLIVAFLQRLGLTPYIGQFVSSGFFTFWNYFWYRFWVFPDKKKHPARAHRPKARKVVKHVTSRQ
jgi:putative flippase GtrA